MPHDCSISVGKSVDSSICFRIPFIKSLYIQYSDVYPLFNGLRVSSIWRIDNPSPYMCSIALRCMMSKAMINQSEESDPDDASTSEEPAPSSDSCYGFVRLAILLILYLILGLSLLARNILPAFSNIESGKSLHYIHSKFRSSEDRILFFQSTSISFTKIPLAYLESS